MLFFEDRPADTLIPLIKQYIHGTVNHSYDFVNSVTGDNTQND